MTQIAYTGLEEDSLLLLKDALGHANLTFQEVAEEKQAEQLQSGAGTLGVYIIGERVGNPIKLAQNAHALDSYLSILIINDRATFAKIKQALLFTPFIGNTVQSFSNEIGPGLANVTQDAIARTQQRRQYQQFQQTTARFQPDAHLYENVKTEYLDKFLEEAPIGAVLMTEQGLVLAVNRHATKIMGLTEKLIIGTPFIKLFDEPHQRLLEGFLTAEFKGSASLTIERSSFKGKKYLEVRIAPISIKSGVSYKIGVVSDFTDKVLAQQQVELQLEELRTINEQLKSANSDLDAFVYTASHDLKAPIGNIEGLIGLIRRRVPAEDEQLTKLFQLLDTSIERFQDTIKDLTEVALLPKRSQDVEIIAVKEVIEEVQMMMHEMIMASEAELYISYNGCSTLHFSKSNFRSLFYNLLTNALKYRSPLRKPIITISLNKTEDYVVLTVADNGLGIAPEQQDRIFGMFKRLHTHVEGTGIGLFIVKRIIDSTGSKIEVESEEGLGSTFKVYLKEQKSPALVQDLLES